MNDKVYLTGDVRFSMAATPLYEEGGELPATKFLLELQKLMEKYAVVKVDIAIDPLT